MASIMEQYQQSTQRQRPSGSANMNVNREVLTSSGFVNVMTEDERPIFNRLGCAISMMLTALSNNVLKRINLYDRSLSDEVQITSRLTDKVHKIFLDPKGKHTIIAMESFETYYLAASMKKVRYLNKFKGHLIESVAWNRKRSTEMTTKEILVGTSKGLIFETELETSTERLKFQSGPEKYFKQVYNLTNLTNPEAANKVERITGLFFDGFPPVAKRISTKYFVIATTPNHMYQFTGDLGQDQPFFAKFFASCDGISAGQFLELPGDKLDYSEFHISYTRKDKLPKYFVWLTEPGIYYGGFDFGDGKSGITTNAVLMDYKSLAGDNPDETNVIPSPPPVSIAVTEYHVLLLFRDRLNAIALLNEEIIFEDYFQGSAFNDVISVVVDPNTRMIWMCTQTSVFQYEVIHEERYVWRMHLEKLEFENAKAYCKDNPAHMDKVLTAQADYEFNKNHYEIAASHYAQSQKPFEEIALKFIEVDKRDALKEFLMRKFNCLENKDKTQMSMLLTWLTELFLNDMGNLKDDGETEKYKIVQAKFRSFLQQQQVKVCLENNPTLCNTLSDLISSHGDADNVIFFAKLMNDIEKVLGYYIQRERYSEALKVLSQQPNPELFYKFSPDLIPHIPREVVSAWMLHETLDAKRLIPSLVHYSQRSSDLSDAIRYLEYCISYRKCKDQAVHDYLLSLYAKSGEKLKLENYLQSQGRVANYDRKYALRLCAEYECHRACVYIYAAMGLFDEAVELALKKVSVNLAKEHAQLAEDDEELKKKLWLLIARHVIEMENDVKQATEFLKDCELLKIEDILPFFSDFVTIDHFKEAISSSLQEYNKHIDSLRDEMQEATESAKSLREDIQEMKNRYSIISIQDTCTVCSFNILSRAFYLFPCGHMFHVDCLIAEILPHLNDRQKSKVKELQQTLSTSYTTEMKEVENASRDQIKEELDELIANECLYCGDIMIGLIDQPFLSPEEFDTINLSWH